MKRKNFDYYYHFPPRIAYQWSKPRPKSDHSRPGKRFFSHEKVKLKYAYSVKLSCSHIYFASFWSFKTTPDFVIIFKNRAFKG